MRLKKEIQYLENKKQNTLDEKESGHRPAYKVFGFKSDGEFVDWCFDNGIKIKNTIDAATADKIARIKKESLVKYQLKMAKDLKNMSFSELLESTQKGAINVKRDNDFYPYLDLFKKGKKRDKGFEKFLTFVVENINLFKKVNNNLFVSYNIDDYAKGLQKIYEYKDFWIRDYKTWEPTRYRSSWWNLVQLIEYLFEDYQMPRIFKTVWFSNEVGDKKIELYIDLCQGSSAYKAMKAYAQNKNVPELTKKQVHSFMNSKHENVLEIEYKKLYLLENGVQKELTAEAVKGSWACSMMDLSLIKDYLLLVQKETMFNKSQIMPLWDYILQVRQQMRNEEKTFVMKNRSIQKLLNDMHEWHEKLNKSKDNSCWEASNAINPYVYEDEKTMDGYYIKELTTARDLITEGKKLSHCVASYAPSCKRGQCSIWSLYKKEFGNTKKLVTLEIERGLTLVQCRGKANRLPNNSEWYHINQWLTHNGLKKVV